MSRIPISKDYAHAVGEWCERVESRSLLHEKLAFPKKWGVGDSKTDQASNWSLMRIATNGGALLENARKDLERRANGRNVSPENSEEFKTAAMLCGALSKTKVGSNLESIQSKHATQFIGLLEQTYSKDNLRILKAKLEGRLAINLAEGMIQNAGIALDRIFGLPYIPGSAVKGVTRRTALEEVKRDETLLEPFVKIFGTSENDYKRGDLKDFDCPPGLSKNLKGAICFLQALPVTKSKIVVDITNVHTPDYYRTGNVADLAKENPRPNYFPAVEKGAVFSFAILLNSMSKDVALLDQAEKWLSKAMEEHGFGAKTASGYGWFSDITEAERQKELEAEKTRLERDAAAKAAAEEKAREEEKKRIAAEKIAKRASMTDEDWRDEVLKDWEITLKGKPLKKLLKNDDLANFNKKKPERQKGIVLALRMNSGIGQDVWKQIKGLAPGQVVALYCKANSMEKMP